MIHAIFLASGSAKRFGSNKLLYPLDGKPIYQHGLMALADAVSKREDCTLTVVSRYEPILACAEEIGAKAVNCPESVGGISFSIRAGVESCGELSDGDRLLLMVADQPYIKSETISKLFDAAVTHFEAVCASYGETEGNPVLFSAKFAPALCSLEGDKGGKSVLRKNGVRCGRVECEDARELADIDTIEDM